MLQHLRAELDGEQAASHAWWSQHQASMEHLQQHTALQGDLIASLKANLYKQQFDTARRMTVSCNKVPPATALRQDHQIAVDNAAAAERPALADAPDQTEELQRMQAEVARLSTAMSKSDAVIAAQHTELAAYVAAAGQLQAEVAQQMAAMQRMEGSLAAKDTANADLQRQLDVELQQVAAAGQQQAELIAQQAAEFQHKDNVIEQLHKLLGEQRADAEQQQDKLHQQQTAMQELDRSNASKDSVIDDLQSELCRAATQHAALVRQLMGNVDEGKARADQLAATIGSRDAAITKVQAEALELAGTVERLEAGHVQQRAVIVQLEGHVQIKDEVIAGLQTELIEHEAATATLQSRLDQQRAACEHVSSAWQTQKSSWPHSKPTSRHRLM